MTRKFNEKFYIILALRQWHDHLMTIHDFRVVFAPVLRAMMDFIFLSFSILQHHNFLRLPICGGSAAWYITQIP